MPSFAVSLVTILPHGKVTASNHGPEDHYTVYKTQHLALTTIITCSTRFSYEKFYRHWL